MSKTENVELTVLCLIEDGDKILLQNRVKFFRIGGIHIAERQHCRAGMWNPENLLWMR